MNPDDNLTIRNWIRHTTPLAWILAAALTLCVIGNLAQTQWLYAGFTAVFLAYHITLNGLLFLLADAERDNRELLDMLGAKDFK